MTVTLCNSPKSDNVSRAYLAKSLSAEKSYYDGLPKKAYSCATVELGQPLRIQASIKNLLGYNYGWIDYGDSMRYYFSITDYSMVSESMTDIIYELDPLATAYNQIGISIPRATLRRFNGEEPNINKSSDKYGKISFPYNPMYWFISDYESHNAEWYAFVLHNSTDNQLYSGLIRNNAGDANLSYLFSGMWFNLLFGDTDYQISDVANFAYVPCDIVAPSTTPYKTASDMDVWLYQGDGNFNVNCSKFKSLSSTPTAKDVILDARGNIVYECPIGNPKTIKYGKLALSVATIAISLYTEYYPLGPSEPSIVEPGIITIPCETIDIYVDAWKEYAYRQRDYDNQIRQINATSSLANIGNAAVSGAVAGAVTGSIVPGIGTAIGAVGGLAVGAVSSAVGTGIQYHYGNEQQKVTDAMYQKAQDTLSLTGNCNPSLIRDTQHIIKCTMNVDPITSANYDDDTGINGYYYDKVISDFEPSNTTKTKYAITADIEVHGPIPTAWKDAIANRFASGLVIEHD